MSAEREMRAFAEAPHQVTSEMLLRWADEVRGLEGEPTADEFDEAQP